MPGQRSPTPWIHAGRRRSESSCGWPSNSATLRRRPADALRWRCDAHGKGPGPFPCVVGVLVMRYGSETVVLSPVAEITKVPAAVSLANAYGLVQPTGGFGIRAMNGPADWLRELTATDVSTLSAPVAGTVPMWAA